MIIEFFPPGFGTATQASPSEVRVGATVFGEGAQPGVAPPNHLRGNLIIGPAGGPVASEEAADEAAPGGHGRWRRICSQTLSFTSLEVIVVLVNPRWGRGGGGKLTHLARHQSPIPL